LRDFPSFPTRRSSDLASALLPGRFVVEFDHHPVGVIDENLPEIAPGHLPYIERHALGLKPLLHPGKSPARESDIVDNAGIRLLLDRKSTRLNSSHRTT